MVSEKLFGSTFNILTNEYFDPFNEPNYPNYLFQQTSGETVPEDVTTTILDIHNAGNNIGDFLTTLSFLAYCSGV